MLFEEKLGGGQVITIERRGDERGFFARAFCQDEFRTNGLDTSIAQANLSWNADQGTLRGLHFQYGDHAEVKMVRCVRGAIWDVMLDLRPDSETFGQHFGLELTAENRTMLYVPRGFAHGYITLTDDTEILYFVTARYHAAAEGGVRWDDPKFRVAWPAPPKTLSPKDAVWPDFDADAHEQKWKMHTSVRGSR
jgi:dTDP-4-dehydrorhamnose 3,5-epimerase